MLEERQKALSRAVRVTGRRTWLLKPDWGHGLQEGDFSRCFSPGEKWWLKPRAQELAFINRGRKES